jgi:TP901 family phage tail tape measure protein
MAFSIGDAFLTINPRLAANFGGVVATQLNDTIGNISDRIGNIGRELSLKVTLPIAAGIGAGVTQFAALDAKLQETATLFSAVGDRATRFTSEFRAGVSSVADDVGLFERDIAPALYQAISAGIPRNNVFEFLDVAARAAVGGVTDIQTTVNGLTTAVNAFASQGLTAEHAADVLFRGVARGKTTFGELSQEMATAAPLAAAAGVAFEEFVAIIATMALSGTTTSEAITQVRAAINGLLRPSVEMAAIMGEAGFETAGLAVQQIGLQKTLGLVVEATQGETGELIKLLGGAEAANGALQITGDNAERFNSIFRDTSNATGAASAAFETMSKTASQTFKNLFVQFDRFASSVGQIAFTVVGPLVRGLTSVVRVVNDVVDSVARGPDVIKALVGGFVGLTAAVGPILLIGSKLLALFGVKMAAQLATGTRAMGTLTAGARLLGGGLALMLGRAISIVPALSGASTAMTNLGRRGLAPMTAQLGGASRAFGAIGAALAVGALGLEVYNDWLHRTIENAKFATTGAKTLADSLGLVVKPAEALEALSEQEINLDFRLTNYGVVKQLIEVRDDLVGLEDRTILLTYQLIQLGNTPEEAIAAAKQAFESANPQIPFSLVPEDINVDSVREAILREAERLQTEIDQALGGNAGRLDNFSSSIVDFFSTTRNELKGEIQQLGELASTVFRDPELGGFENALTILKQLEDQFGADSEAVDELNDAFLYGLMEGNDALKLTTVGFTSVDEVIRELRENLVLTADEIALLEEAGVQAASAIGQAAPEFTPEQIKEQVNTIASAMEELDETILGVQQRINQRLVDITDGLVSQIPFWGEYAGAAEQSSRDVIESLDRFNADLVAWGELSRSLIGEVPEGLRAELEKMPLEQKAWLTQLANEAPDRFDAVIAAYEDSFALVEGEAVKTWQTELPDLIAEGNAEIAAKARELEGEFGKIGTNVANQWRRHFETAAATWADAVAHYAGRARNAALAALLLTDAQLPPVPTLPPIPTYPQPVGGGGPPVRYTLPYQGGGETSIGTSYTYNYEYHITPGPTSSIQREVEKVVQVARTQELVNRIQQN